MSVEWIHLDTDQWQAFMNTVLNLQVLYDAGDFLNGWETVHFSSIQLHRISQFNLACISSPLHDNILNTLCNNVITSLKITTPMIVIITRVYGNFRVL
jgi:hypothetical protein